MKFKKVGKQVLIFGEALEVMAKAPDNHFDACICDPPYGTTRCKWDSIIPLDKMWEQLKRIVKPNGAIVLNAAQPFTSALVMSNTKMFKYDLVWDKKKPTGMFNARRQPLRRKEDVIVFYKKQCTYNPQKIKNPKGVEKRSLYSYNRDNIGGETTGSVKQGGVSTDYEPDKLLPTNVLVFSKPNRPIHPTQKPISLMEYLIKTYTNKGGRVLDFSMGSGTTILACQNLNRLGVGIDNGHCEKKKVVNGHDINGLSWVDIAKLRLEGKI